MSEWERHPAVAAALQNQEDLEVIRTIGGFRRIVKRALKGGYGTPECRSGYDALLNREPGPLRDATLEMIEEGRLKVLTAEDPICRLLTVQSPSSEVTFESGKEVRDWNGAVQLALDAYGDSYDDGATIMADLLEGDPKYLLHPPSIHIPLLQAYGHQMHAVALRLTEHYLALPDLKSTDRRDVLILATRSAGNLGLWLKTLQWGKEVFEQLPEQSVISFLAKATLNLGRRDEALHWLTLGLSRSDRGAKMPVYQDLLTACLMKFSTNLAEIQPVLGKDRALIIAVATKLSAAIEREGHTPDRRMNLDLLQHMIRQSGEDAQSVPRQVVAA